MISSILEDITESRWERIKERNWREDGEESSQWSFCSTNISMFWSSDREKLQSEAITSLYRVRGRGSCSLEARLGQAEASSWSCEEWKEICDKTVSKYCTELRNT